MTITFTKGELTMIASTGIVRPGDAKDLARFALGKVNELEAAQKSNEFLKCQLSELANFNPDWDKLEASYESWREIAAELLVAKDRIAELEQDKLRLHSAINTQANIADLTAAGIITRIEE